MSKAFDIKKATSTVVGRAMLGAALFIALALAPQLCSGYALIGYAVCIPLAWPVYPLAIAAVAGVITLLNAWTALTVGVIGLQVGAMIGVVNVAYDVARGSDRVFSPENELPRIPPGQNAPAFWVEQFRNAVRDNMSVAKRVLFNRSNTEAEPARQ